MKLFVISLLIFSSLYLQATSLKIVVKDIEKPVQIFRLDYGDLIEFDTYKALKRGDEKIVSNLEVDQFYIVRIGLVSRFFCADSDELEMEIEGDKMEFINPKGLNKALDEWYTVSDSIRCKSSEFYRSPSMKIDTALFFSEYKELEVLKSKVINKYSKSLRSDKLKILQTVAGCDMDYFLYSYILNPCIYGLYRSSQDFMKEVIKNPHFNSSNFLDIYPTATFYLLKFIKLAERSGLKIDDIFEQFKSNDLKAFYVCIKAKEAKTYSEIKNFKAKWEQYFTSQVLKDRFESIAKEIRRLTIGEPGFEFALPDINGDTVRLSDFKEKVVLVYLWGSFCGPCKKEIPHLLELKKDFVNTDLVVVGISTDKIKLKNNWLSIARSVGGVQLLDSENTLSQYYKCTSVPHFLIFDKEGRIASLKAPRPSNPKLRNDLKKILGNIN